MAKKENDTSVSIDEIKQKLLQRLDEKVSIKTYHNRDEERKGADIILRLSAAYKNLNGSN